MKKSCPVTLCGFLESWWSRVAKDLWFWRLQLEETALDSYLYFDFDKEGMSWDALMMVEASVLGVGEALIDAVLINLSEGCSSRALTMTSTNPWIWVHDQLHISELGEISPRATQLD